MAIKEGRKYCSRQCNVESLNNLEFLRKKTKVVLRKDGLIDCKVCSLILKNPSSMAAHVRGKEHQQNIQKEVEDEDRRNKAEKNNL